MLANKSEEDQRRRGEDPLRAKRKKIDGHGVTLNMWLQMK